ncbi:cupin domain-containing protein [Planktothrix sp. FACHB-1355]|uniref:Cupin domain-containing protein n=1 Tax=Aerosakkonema funiforme FACHB-1375 TaxID=2949571 RepID=A0A926ZKD5_9CYAN|nr:MULTISPECIES: cupin domain-containing protein [Oscillatoriales]MBD2185664.1 cupin domain-containing protein [Aerosakkonema funiforme FACHB-1375]MBD3557709.1 cupin domain-containing protein [Planktothrix sp. FACHB-1355]
MVTSTTKLVGFATQLRDLIEYGDSGVRRQIVTKDEKRQAILVCLKAGTVLNSHTSSHDGFITVIEGQGVFTLEGQEIALEPGVFVAMPANAVHSVNAIANLAFLKIVDRHDDCQEHP